jgi:hypothetical protein
MSTVGALNVATSNTCNVRETARRGRYGDRADGIGCRTMETFTCTAFTRSAGDSDDTPAALEHYRSGDPQLSRQPPFILSEIETMAAL